MDVTGTQAGDSLEKKLKKKEKNGIAGWDPR